jgi:HSP20 family protein
MSMLTVVPFSQFSRPSRVSSIFASLFDEVDTFNTNTSNIGPKANINKEENDYHIDLAIPGYNHNDISVSIKEGTLTIEAEVEDDSLASCSREFNVASFKRRWTLPNSVDEEGISAKYKDGVLKLIIPSSKESCRKIDININ